MTGGALRSRTALAAAVAVAAVVSIALVVLLGGSDGSGQGRLAWEGQPRLLAPLELPDDRILSGRLRNASSRKIALDADRVRLLAADGRPVPSTARFAAGFAHGLYSPRDAPREVAEQERERLGETATLRPGQSVPVTLSWRAPEGTPPPVRADLGGILLVLPRG